MNLTFLASVLLKCFAINNIASRKSDSISVMKDHISTINVYLELPHNKMEIAASKHIPSPIITVYKVKCIVFWVSYFFSTDSCRTRCGLSETARLLF